MLASLVALSAWAEPRLEHIGTFVWDRPEDYFGGWSAIDVLDGGTEFVAVGDNAQLYEGTFERLDGVISGVVRIPVGALRDTDGIEYFRKIEDDLADSEGVAWVSGGFAVSFERHHRIMLYLGEAAPTRLELPKDLESSWHNGGIEALATDNEGRLIAIPETRPKGASGFAVWRQRDTGWETVGEISRSQGFAPVGADFGPDGKLYVLERAFRFVGFQSRVRAFDLKDFDPDGDFLWVSPLFAFDNLEGISVWSADDEIRATLISDDNYNWFQRTEIVEFRLTE